MRSRGTKLGLGLALTAVTVAMTVPPSRWTTTLKPVSVASVTGTAELDSAGPATSTARISIRGDRPGSVRPWHVHHGTCGKAGSILGPATDYPPMKIGPDSTASATASLNVAAPARGDYLVNVHDSPSDLETIVACGKLRRSGK
jgi:hypothetical protein